MANYQNTTDTQILRIDILEEGASFNTSDNDHNAQLILEDSNGHAYGNEYISIEEFQHYMVSFCHFKSDEQFWNWLMNSKDDSYDIELIDFTITDYEILNHLEDFRCSEFNISQSIHPIND